MIVVVDYGMGNLRSVESALRFLGAACVVSSDPQCVRSADKLILPGVGAFAAAVENLRVSGLREALQEAVINKQRYILGICLGMELFADKSYEGGVSSGFSWIGGEVVRISAENSKIKVPHIGFNRVIPNKEKSVLLRGLEAGADFYFVHSYHFKAGIEHTSATCHYGECLVAAVEKDNVLGTQFHPEKSQGNGLTVLKNFIEV